MLDVSKDKWSTAGLGNSRTPILITSQALKKLTINFFDKIRSNITWVMSFLHAHIVANNQLVWILQKEIDPFVRIIGF